MQDLGLLLKHLTEKQRRRVWMRYFADPPLSYAEIAKQEGINPKTVWRSINQAHKKLEKLGKKLTNIGQK